MGNGPEPHGHSQAGPPRGMSRLAAAAFLRSVSERLLHKTTTGKQTKSGFSGMDSSCKAVHANVAREGHTQNYRAPRGRNDCSSLFSTCYSSSMKLKPLNQMTLL